MFIKIKSYLTKVYTAKSIAVIFLVFVKLLFQIIVMQSGLKWLTADDYSRTVISWDWLQNPKVYSGVWLSFHFWLNGIFIWFFKDLTLSPLIANTLFSVLTLIFLYKIIEKVFNKNIAFLSCLIYCVFPFQVWLSASGMPESIFFFFVTFSCYYLLTWYSELKTEPESPKAMLLLLFASLSLNAANLLRYEGWFFSLGLIILTGILSFKKNRLSKTFFINLGLSLISLISAVWWMYRNSIDYGDPFFFARETTKIYEGLNGAGLFQRIIQYPFFIFYIAPLTTILALWKIIKTLSNKQNGFMGNFSLLKVFLLFNIIELLILMLTGITGSGGTNMISRYIVLNSMFIFPFAVWQLIYFKKYIVIAGMAVLILVNIIWSFYYQPAYREDTYEVAELTSRLIHKNYFEPDDKIYFERVEGYFDIYPLQVISNNPARFISDTIPSNFPVKLSTSKKVSKQKLEEEQQNLNILTLRKFLEEKHIKLFIARSDLLIDKLKKLSYKSEQIGDYRLFYLSENKIKYKRNNGTDSNKQVNLNGITKNFAPNEISFGKKLILKDYRFDNTNFGMNPQTVTLRWEIADISFLDSLATTEDEFGRYKIKLELASSDNDSVAYDTYTNIFSERNTEEFFDTEEIKNILILKPFAMLNYSRKFKSSPFESGLYDIRLSIIDDYSKKELMVYKGDSLYVYFPETEKDSSDTTAAFIKAKLQATKDKRDIYLSKPYFPIGRIIAMFPNADYNALLKKSSDFSKIIIRNGMMLPFLNRYQGDHFLNIVFNYF